MSGHRPFAEIRNNSPEFRAEVETETRALRVALELVRLREEMGLTQQQLAERMSVSQEAVSQLENARDLRVSSISRYVTALGGEVRLAVRLPDRAEVQLDLPAAS
jgi:DNA-binding XRE family transcriptional regulator